MCDITYSKPYIDHKFSDKQVKRYKNWKMHIDVPSSHISFYRRIERSGNLSVVRILPSSTPKVLRLGLKNLSRKHLF
jgi:hypothetical protein